ncbi:MAG: fibrobacter succinogenes major paralogous domain-containing protein [Ferruginibacter sp.]
MIYIFLMLLFFGKANAQNVGIGTTSPSANLHINGSFKITNGSQGNGKILTSNAAGLATWKQALDTGAYYPAVGICCATWMTKNLDVVTYRNGDTIPQVTDATAWSLLTTGAWCYINNDPVAGAVYGKLYNWYAINDTRGLAPYGWHIPSTFEFTTLYNCLGGNVALAGGALKEKGITHWASPNTNATNFSGFNGFGAGLRYSTGQFLLGFDAAFWSATESMANNTFALTRTLYYANADFAENNNAKKCGLSIRCIKD